MTIMPRPVTKLSEEQQDLLAAAVTAAKKADESEARFVADNRAALEAIQAARKAKVPDTLLKRETGWSRMKFHRRLGPRRAQPDADD